MTVSGFSCGWILPLCVLTRRGAGIDKSRLDLQKGLLAQARQVFADLGLHLGTVERIFDFGFHVGKRSEARLGVVLNLENLEAGRDLDGLA